MNISGLEKISLIDYPGKLAAVLFFQGCNWRCPYCHNPQLLKKEDSADSMISQKDLFRFLDKRQGLLDGLCLTGGEPTLQSGLIGFIKKIKKKGFLVKLDTNGSQPAVLEELLKNNLIDFLAMDIKTSPWRYPELLNKDESVLEDVLKSIELIKQASISYQFRTTAVPSWVGEREMKEISRWLKGADWFVLQQFKPGQAPDPAYQTLQPYSFQKLNQLLAIIKPFVFRAELVGL